MESFDLLGRRSFISSKNGSATKQDSSGCIPPSVLVLPFQQR